MISIKLRPHNCPSNQKLQLSLIANLAIGKGHLDRLGLSCGFLAFVFVVTWRAIDRKIVFCMSSEFFELNWRILISYKLFFTSNGACFQIQSKGENCSKDSFHFILVPTKEYLSKYFITSLLASIKQKICQNIQNKWNTIIMSTFCFLRALQFDTLKSTMFLNQLANVYKSNTYIKRNTL